MKSIALLLLLAVPLVAQDAAPTGAPSSHRIVTRTRTVTLFDGLENRVMDAVVKKDKAAIEQLTTDDFEVRNSYAPSEPTPREDWINLAGAAHGYNLKDFRISHTSVHMYGDSTAVVSMTYWQNATLNGKNRSGDFFLVDVWTKTGDDWKLSVRYAGPVEGKPAPGHGPQSLPYRKPTGRE